MNIPDNETIIIQTKKWITDVVVGCGFCPFAARELKRGSIHYEVLANANNATVLRSLSAMFYQLDTDKETETSLLILPNNFDSFNSYLSLIDMAESFLAKEKYEGIYQVASFHPNYLFAGSNNEDPANYTNRSPYPMLHILREESVSKAVDSYLDIDEVPQRNIRFANKKGLDYMRKLLAMCMDDS